MKTIIKKCANMDEKMKKELLEGLDEYVFRKKLR
jgi:hypothetical protein